MTHNTDSDRAEFEDGAWYWVEKDGWPPTITPALYKAASKAWYSFAFSGIPTRQVKVLEPCRRAPSAPVPQDRADTLLSRIRKEIDHAAINDHRMPPAFGKRIGEPCVKSAYLEATIEGWELETAPQPPEAEKCTTCQSLEAEGVNIKQCTVAAPVQMPEPVCFALYDSQGFYETRDTEKQCIEFCTHYNARDARLGGGLAPYSYRPLYAEHDARAHNIK